MPGQTPVSVYVDNPTSVAISSFAVELYHNRATAPGPFDVGNQEVINLSLGAYQSTTVNFTVAGPSSPATWSMWAYVDRIDDVQESNESDNTYNYQQVWGQSPQLNLTYFGVHGDTGFIVIEFQLSGVSTAISSPYPQFYVAFRGAAIPASALVIKRPPSVVDGRSYCISWNSRASVAGDESGVLFFQITIASGVTASAQATITVRNSPDSIKHRRSIWLTDSDQRQPVKVTPNIVTILESVTERERFLDFCINPSQVDVETSDHRRVRVNTHGNPVSYTTVYFTLWHWDDTLGGYAYLDVTQSPRTQQMRSFIASAQSRGIRVFAAIDKDINWALAGTNLTDTIDDVVTFNSASGPGGFEGVIVNVEFGASEITQYGTSWWDKVASLKYDVTSAPLAGKDLQLRLAVSPWWENSISSDPLTNYTSTSLFPLVDSVLCLNYHSNVTWMLQIGAEELIAGSTAGVSVEFGFETQPYVNIGNGDPAYEYVTLHGNNGTEQLELCVNEVYAQMPSLQRSGFCGYNVFYFQAYVDIDPVSSEDNSGEDLGCIASSNRGIGVIALILLVATGVTLKIGRYSRTTIH